MKPTELRAFMLRWNLDNEAVEELFGVASSTVQSWLRGTRNIYEPVARAIRLFDRRPELMDEYENMGTKRK